MTTTTRLDPTRTINQIVAEHPETMAVFNRFGLDTCCGGGVCVAEAAKRDGIDPDQVISALNEALSSR
jgi:regulator of cell morphogenesis and NO signaling